MTRMVVLASALLLACTLAGCRTYGPFWRVEVENRASTSRERPVRVCTGALTATVLVGAKVRLAAAAAPDDVATDEVRHEGVLRAGDAVVLDATCTDAAGSEVGYVRVEGRVLPPQYTMHVGSTFVLPPPASGDGPLYPSCLSPTDERGQPPCILERLVMPD